MVKFAFCILMNRAFMNTPPIDWFRRCTPYINAHQGKTFVIMFDGDALTSDNFDKLIHDFVLLHSLKRPDFRALGAFIHTRLNKNHYKRNHHG